MCLASFCGYEQAVDRFCFNFLQNLNNIKCRRQITSPWAGKAQKLHWRKEERRGRIASSCVCVRLGPESNPLPDPGLHNGGVWSPKARGNVHLNQRLLSAELRSKVVIWIVLVFGNVPYSADWGHEVWPQKPVTPNPVCSFLTDGVEFPRTDEKTWQAASSQWKPVCMTCFSFALMNKDAPRHLF